MSSRFCLRKLSLRICLYLIFKWFLKCLTWRWKLNEAIRNDEEKLIKLRAQIRGTINFRRRRRKIEKEEVKEKVKEGGNKKGKY